MVVPMPLGAEVEQAHPVEYRLGELAVRGVRKTFGVRLDAKREASGIALSIVNAAVAPSQRGARAIKREDILFKKIPKIIHREMGAEVDENSFAYTRFSTHISYLLERIAKGEPLERENAGLFEAIAAQYSESAACARAIAREIEATYDASLTEDELLYLIMHINRVTAS